MAGARGTPAAVALLLLLGVLPGQRLLAAAVDAPVGTWNAFTTAGSYEYKWTLQKSINDGQPGATVNFRVQKGVKAEVTYKLTYTRELDQTTAKMTVSGSLTLANNNGPNDPAAVPPVVNDIALSGVSVTLTSNSAQGTPSTFDVTCTPAKLAPGDQATCTFTDQAYGGFMDAGTATAKVTWTGDGGAGGTADVPASPPFSFESVQGKFATAILTDKADLSPLSSMYTGFRGFQSSSVWRYVDPSTAIPESGVTVEDSGQKTYTVSVGSFVMCTGTSGITIQNTATLTPQQSGSSGVKIPQTANVQLEVWGCEMPPDVNFQDLKSWGAQTFKWQMSKQATRNAFNVDLNAGAVPIEYKLTAQAQPTTGSYAVSGAVFINNVQPGILNIAQLSVQLSSGQQAVPVCALTTPYVSSDGLVWGGANAGGSITTMPNTGFGVGMGVSGMADGLGGAYASGMGTMGAFTEFIIPEFSSATCRFNLTMGTEVPGGTVQIVPYLRWGFGGMYMLNQPSQMQVNFNPPDNYFPVAGCLSVTDVATGSPLELANGGPNNQQMCVEGAAQPFTQPAPIVYTVTASINPSLMPGCQAGASKTFAVTNTATGTPLGGAGGGPVTATADPPVSITVACPADANPTVAVNPAQAVVPTANLNVMVGGFQTFVAGEHKWTAEKKATPDLVSLAIGALPQTVTYTLTVTKLPASAEKQFVSGTITVTNPGNDPVPISAVSVTAGSAAVPAKCPEGSTSVPPGAPIVCAFNVTWNNGAASGSLGARVDTPEASFYGQPASFDFTNPKRGGTRGDTADIFDDFTGTAPANATGVPTKWWQTDGNAPPGAADGIPLTTVDSRVYNYTVQVGPFADKGACGTYTLLNTATVVPSDASGSKVTASSTVSVSVTGCRDNELLDVKSKVAAVISEVKTARVRGSTWAVEAAGPAAALPLGAGKARSAVFNVSFAKVPKITFEVSGTVAVTNTNGAAAVDVSGVTVALESANGTARTVDATCGPRGGGFKLAPGTSIPCSFTAALESPDGGSAIAIVTDGDGQQTESPSLPFDYKNATKKESTATPACAMATAGLVVGLPTWQPGGAVRSAANVTRICDSQPVTVPVTLGPLPPGVCGNLTVVHVATLNPLSPSIPGTLAATPMTVAAKCADGKSAAALPVAVAEKPKVEVQELYTWNASLTHDAPPKFSISQSSPQKVTFVARTQRSPVKKSVSIEGVVTVAAPAEGAKMEIASATVAVYDSRAQYTSVPLTCGNEKPGGPFVLKRGAKLTCTYNATGLALGSGAVLPVLLPAGGAAGGGAPLPAQPAAFTSHNASRNIVGDCADIGSSMMLSNKKGSRALWQPAFVGQPFGSGSDCEGGDTTRFSLMFGGDASGKSVAPRCGDYGFTGTLTLLPTNGGAVVSEAKFPVRVSCRK
ncbi:hypothetical protein Rsub_09431 [Raphidocelis subcapitata]|uniref:Uncharacterized protein n=1 Tax=Raphidocelis subcapitata TaxID=307507 RepID=A0A2V0PEP9_9CHLO|nr:hypothetical protein Rsub_09431 [Raphidocelis subcapitata]|eukprot:GBF96360.1 hypothetical protein Rsub_09431 [Raphidocelis subcapitata]